MSDFVEYPLGDGVGSVEYIDSMGDDGSICRAARVSSGHGSKGESSDARLINFLMANRHTTPFEHCELAVHVKAPVFVERQWFRHRTASVNSASMRYKEMPDEVWVPRSGDLHLQSVKNRQGGIAAPDPTLVGDSIERIERVYSNARVAYELMVAGGIAREDARVVLPLGQYTEFYWKIDLHNLLHFLELRLHPHAQREIRLYAASLARLARSLWPIAWKAFEEHRLYALAMPRRSAWKLGEAMNSDGEFPQDVVDIILDNAARCSEIAELIDPPVTAAS